MRMTRANRVAAMMGPAKGSQETIQAKIAQAAYNTEQGFCQVQKVAKSDRLLIFSQWALLRDLVR
jgi:hypothetical protein